ARGEGAVRATGGEAGRTRGAGRPRRDKSLAEMGRRTRLVAGKHPLRGTPMPRARAPRDLPRAMSAQLGRVSGSGAVAVGGGVGGARAAEAGWSVFDLDADAAEAAALVLHLGDSDAADLLGGGDVGAAVGLGVEADDVDDADVLDFGRYEVRGRPDDVGDLERLVPREGLDVDAPVGLDLGVARVLDGLLETGRDLAQVEVHAGGQRLHVAARHEAAVVAEDDAAEQVQPRVRAHQRGAPVVLDRPLDDGADGRDGVALHGDEHQVFALADPGDP